MERLPYKPNGKRHRMFLQFEKGKRPSELKVAKEDYALSMKYFEEYKRCERHKKEKMDYLRDGMNDKLNRIKDSEKRRGAFLVYEGILKNIHALPIEIWFFEERAEREVRIHV